MTGHFVQFTGNRIIAICYNLKARDASFLYWSICFPVGFLLDS